MNIRRILIVFVLLCIALCVHSQGELRRLTALKHPKIGLALGGGGAKGAAEVGVLKALEEEGLKFDYIAGTSIGSIIGALYSCGYRALDIEKLFLSQSWISLLTDLDSYVNQESRKSRKQRKKKDDSDGYSIGGLGLSHGDQLIELFDSLTGKTEPIQFDKLPIPFRCVATDLRTQEPVVMSEGLLSVALRASMSIPGMFKPVHLNGHTLVDGGMQNNLPVDVVRDMGAEYVITIDLTVNKHKPRSFSLKETFGIGGLLDWFISRPDWAQYDANVKASDMYINPILDGFDTIDFQRDKIEQMIEIGYRIAKKELEKYR